jgi:hypothetical protein
MGFGGLGQTFRFGGRWGSCPNTWWVQSARMLARSSRSLTRARLEQWRDLLAQQDAKQAHKGHDGRGRRADIQERVDHADQQADGKGDQIGLHDGSLRPPAA